MIKKKYKDIPLMNGFKITHKLTECKYPSGNIAHFYHIDIMQDTHNVEHFEFKLEALQ